MAGPVPILPSGPGLGLAVGLALQGAMTHLAVGVMLRICRPYKVGDFAERLMDPASFVEVSTLNDSSVDFFVRPFCDGSHCFDLLFSLNPIRRGVLF